MNKSAGTLKNAASALVCALNKPGVASKTLMRARPHVEIYPHITMAMSLAEVAPCPTAVATLKHAGRQMSPAA